jgi:cholera toxin transcriptional activator
MAGILKYKFGEFEADLRAAELRRRGLRLKMQMQPFQVLIALLERPHDVVTREELRQRLWPEDTFVDFDHGLNTAVAKLRETLGDSASTPKYVETIAKRGYRFLADVEKMEERAPVAQAEPAAKVPQNAGLPASPSPLSASSLPGSAPAVSSATAEVAPQISPVDQDSAKAELPRASRRTSRTLFVLAQIMYMAFYVSALFRLDRLHQSAEMAWKNAGQFAFVIYLVTALVGLVVRLYLISATALDYHLLGEKFRVLFPALFVLDMLWALAPFMLADRIGVGLALGSTAALIYMPFAQRTLVKMMQA